MGRRRSLAVLAAALAVAGGGCRHAPVPAASLPPDWRTLLRAPAPFAALYRLACCGQTGLVLAVRSAGDRMSLSVAVPPGGAAAAVWFEGGRGWAERAKDRCREPLPAGLLPLPKGGDLALEPAVAVRVLSGVLPEGARELASAPGWVEASDGDLTWRARVEGAPARCTRVVVARHGEARPILEAALADHAGPVPKTIALTAGSQAAALELVEWRASGPLQPPAWMAAPACGFLP